ncbi:MAG: hypothetical protein CME70_01565 [Halobacteriovorax sp.]|nr:hypothetical protein [Halobacteriovorax sp.]|tara:strand:+ start:1161 stop:2537 length:1377 start_codon:yes stop_codon:yes gene_type:complete
MAENNALDTKEIAEAWLAGEVVEGINITIDEYMARKGIFGEDAIQAEKDTILASVTKQANEAVKTDPALVSSSGNTDAASLGISETETGPTLPTVPEEQQAPGTPTYTADTSDSLINTTDVFVMQGGGGDDGMGPEAALVFTKLPDGNIKVTDVITGESGTYSMSGPTGSLRDAYLISATPDGHVLWKNRALTGYRQTNESSPIGQDYDALYKTTKQEAVDAALAALPVGATDEHRAQAAHTAATEWNTDPRGGGNYAEIKTVVGGGGGPQLGDLPSFSSQAEIDQDRYDSTSAAGRAIMEGKSVPRFSMATSPGTAQFFGGLREMPIPTLQSLGSMTPAEAANYSAAARMFQKPEYGDLVNLSRERWSGRRTAPTAVMGGMAGGFGGFNQGSSYMPSRAPRPMRAATSRSQAPFGFRGADSGGARGSVRRASFNRPTRLRAAAVRSGRDGLIRGSTV